MYPIATCGRMSSQGSPHIWSNRHLLKVWTILSTSHRRVFFWGNPDELSLVRSGESEIQLEIQILELLTLRPELHTCLPTIRIFSKNALATLEDSDGNTVNSTHLVHCLMHNNTNLFPRLVVSSGPEKSITHRNINSCNYKGCNSFPDTLNPALVLAHGLHAITTCVAVTAMPFHRKFLFSRSTIRCIPKCPMSRCTRPTKSSLSSGAGTSTIREPFLCSSNKLWDNHRKPLALR